MSRVLCAHGYPAADCLLCPRDIRIAELEAALAKAHEALTAWRRVKLSVMTSHGINTLWENCPSCQADVSDAVQLTEEAVGMKP